MDFQIIIATIVGNEKRGWTAIDDFTFEPHREDCSVAPASAFPPMLAHACTFEDGVCSQWILDYGPGMSFWNITSAKQLEDSNIAGPLVDHSDSNDGKHLIIMKD